MLGLGRPTRPPAAKRGEALFRQRFSNNDKMPACTSCHTDNPLNAGQHAITGKSVKPLAVAANAAAPSKFAERLEAFEAAKARPRVFN